MSKTASDAISVDEITYVFGGCMVSPDLCEESSMQDIPYDASHVPIDYDDRVNVSSKNPYSTVISFHSHCETFIGELFR